MRTNRKGQTGKYLLEIAVVVIILVVVFFFVQDIIAKEDDILSVDKSLYDDDWDGDGVRFNDKCPCAFDNEPHPVLDPETKEIVGLCKAGYNSPDTCPSPFRWITQETGKQGCFYNKEQCKAYAASKPKRTVT